MFSGAYELATKFTKPVVLSTKTYDGTVISGCAAYILLNNEGWILTANHVIQPSIDLDTHKRMVQAFEVAKQQILRNVNLRKRQKEHRIAELNPNKKWLTNVSFWWGNNAYRINTFHYFPAGDLAIGQIENYTPEAGQIYPKFIDPSRMRLATSLCKLGFPFHEIKSTFDNGTFHLAPNALPIPFFPIDGIFTRELFDNSQQFEFPVRYIETSSPGLKGQSGGPVFDKDGNIWAMQVRTNFLSLGFKPKLKDENGNEVEENQFINVGIGVHPLTIIPFLDKYHVSYEKAV